jgi:HAD superfamily hydrolase (TIGR01484 family)
VGRNAAQKIPVSASWQLKVPAVFTDLDGSLHHADAGFHPEDYQALIKLGQQGIPRTIVTGRSLYSARKVLTLDFPIDYLIFSSGAGIFDWSSQTLLQSNGFTDTEFHDAQKCLNRFELDYMLHAAVPDNHHLWYKQYSQTNPDFEARLALYQEFATPIQDILSEQNYSQFLVLVPSEATESTYHRLLDALPLSIIRATSPLDFESGWLEVFPAHVSKSQSSEWLCSQFAWEHTMALGNDYNDLDLLHWADWGFATVYAPELLKQHFDLVNCPSQGGFSQAVDKWLKTLIS